MPNWTKEQTEAIELEGTNIIVSAGAGSGKTAVLTTRVQRKLKEGVNINELLILTFTKAAASEMKERIRTNIKKEESLKKQLDYIDSAYITTFDSFALSIVKKYHDLLNVSKSISVMDETIGNTLKRTFLEEIFEEFYKEKEPHFLKLISDFCLRDDEEIKKMILDLSKKLDLLPNKKEYLETYVGTYFRNEKIEEFISDYVSLIKEKITVFERQLQRFSTYVDGDYMEQLEAIFSPLFSASTYKDIYELKLLKFPNLPRGTEEEVKEKKSELVDAFKEITLLCSYQNEEEMKEDYLLTKDYIIAIIKLLLELDFRVKSYKKEHDSYEFSDIALLAIEVVKNHVEVKEELKHAFKEILIDEYQDTSDLQETFISFIANHNVYMVGDIKQSIYRFRNANPYIFKKKYDAYSKKEDGLKIDLNKNFRSRKEVLDNINYLFDYWMDDQIGGASYRESHQMIFGNETYLKEGKTEQNYDFEIFNYPFEKGFPYQKDEIEAFIIARDIQKKVEGHYQIFDKKNGALRDIRYSDFSILIDRGTSFPLYKKIFEYLQIPLTVYRKEKITNEVDIYVFKNILKIILKIKKEEFDQEFQYCFISIARSFLFEMKDDEILKIFIDHSFKNTKIYELAKSLSDSYDVYTCPQMVTDILNYFSFYEKIILLGDVDKAFVRFEYLENMAENLSQLGYSLEDFTNYLEQMIKTDSDIRYDANIISSDSCKIMTIHTSKGLEFPICYFAGLSNLFNKQEIQERFSYNSKYGIVTPYYKEGIGSLFLKELIKKNYYEEEISEKIRLFYVALTRAKEKMIFIASLPEDGEIEKEEGIVLSSVRLGYRSFQDMLKSVLPMLKNYRVEINLDEISLTKDYLLTKEMIGYDTLKTKNSKFEFGELHYEEIKEEEHHFSKEISHFVTIEEAKNMEFGTKLHEILEHLDLKHPNLEMVPVSYRSFIQPFLFLPFMKTIDNANVYQEYEFYDSENALHGIIDLLIEWEDKIFIIDYKLKNIKDDAYQKQLNGYRTYIEKKTGKPVSIYLYSILKHQLEKIN